MSEKDMLKELWEKQQELILRIGVDSSNLTGTKAHRKSTASFAFSSSAET